MRKERTPYFGIRSLSRLIGSRGENIITVNQMIMLLQKKSIHIFPVNFA